MTAGWLDHAEWRVLRSEQAEEEAGARTQNRKISGRNTHKTHTLVAEMSGQIKYDSGQTRSII
jgi:hypothetical protein